ncbi:MAG: aminoglycoside 3'-phosphotransferase [Chloroflexus aggregans]|uniref:Aminoglycoside 3'-phosphotransferase n=1 Tax=Chloroflexus aggregans TaxID=152260 RepID=A0A2J6X724_9CHLR|nr:MAG: aminoglycoside 3'-phosphotransferase [Chloroflexus aggregans]
MPHLHLPATIQTLLDTAIVTDITIGCSAACVYHLALPDYNLYLKIQPVGLCESLAREAHVLHWLRGRLPVPEVVEYTYDEQREYLVTSEIAGMNCVAVLDTLDPESIVCMLADGLRMIHALDITHCPFDSRLVHRLVQARYNVEHDLVDEDDFDPDRRGIMTAREVLTAIEQTSPPEDDLVFSHGDYCLPNVIVQDGVLHGFVDWGRAGIADRYHDLALASRSIRFNLGEANESLFFAAYGLEQVDLTKITYYRLLDELF